MVKNFTRAQRNRFKLKKNSNKLRLSVFKSNKHIYAQIIDDKMGKTLVAASTLSKEIKGNFKNVTSDAAKSVGELIANKAKDAKIKEVCFDRGSYLFHGNVKTLADTARENGLKF